MNPFLLQQQIKNNYTELQSYLEDLAVWEKEVKTTDSKLTNGKLTLTKQKPVAPIRGSSVVTASHTKVPENEQKKEQDPVESQEFITEKEKGNQFFAEGKLEEALDSYTKCLKIAPKSSVAFSNRAAVYLKLQRWCEADQDCTQALRADPSNHKARYRRAVARNQQNKLNEAIQDLQAILNQSASQQSSDSTNKVPGEVYRLLKELRLKQDIATRAAEKNQAIKTDPRNNFGNEVQRKKVVIEMVDDEDDDDDDDGGDGDENHSIQSVLKSQ